MRSPAIRSAAPGLWLRVLVAAALAVALAAAGHVAGGMAAPSAPVLLGSFAALLLPARWLLSRQPGAGKLLAALLVAQFLAHLVFALSADGSLSGALLCTAHAGGHATAGALPRSYHVRTPGMHWGIGRMLIAHTAASALLAGWLRFGERQAWSLVCWLRARMCRLPQVPAAAPSLARRACLTPATVPAPRPLAHRTLLTRGPPRAGRSHLGWPFPAVHPGPPRVIPSPG